MKTFLYVVALAAVLGVLDGATAWFTPEARPQLGQIIVGSVFKDVLGGVVIWVFARKAGSLRSAVLFGACVGFLLALVIALLQNAHYVQILVPGSLTGLLVGYAARRLSPPAAPGAQPS
jgi:hypothetical protein